MVQQALDHCTAANVTQMEQAMDCIYRKLSRGYRHDCQADGQVVDVDMSGWLCGKKEAFASTLRHRCGRQLGRVLATRYQEVVGDRLFPGNRQLNAGPQALMQAAQATLQLTPAQRARSLVRIAAGGGSVPNLNWLLEQGYQIQGKACSGKPAHQLAKGVQEWIPDPHLPRAASRVGHRASDGLCATGPSAGSALSPSRREMGRRGAGWLDNRSGDPAGGATSRRGGGCEPRRPEGSGGLRWPTRGGAETGFKGDKGGLGLTKRNTRRFEAQQMLMLLGTLAHHVIVWAHAWLTTPQSTAQGALTPEAAETSAQTRTPCSGMASCVWSATYFMSAAFSVWIRSARSLRLCSIKMPFSLVA